MDLEKKIKEIPQSVGVAAFVCVLMLISAMGSLAFLQFTSWTVPFYLFAAIPLPVGVLFLVAKVLWPAINKSKKDDKDVSLVAFVIYYFTIIVGWAMIWMIIFHVAPDSYEHIDTFDPKDAYHVFGYILVGATFVSFRTAPAYVLPARLISNLVSWMQIWMAWMIELVFFAFIMKIAFKHLYGLTQKKKPAPLSRDSSQRHLIPKKRQSALEVSIVLAQEDCAFMTLIAGPESEFIDGAIALGRSLLNVREEDYDMVLLHTTQFNLIDAQRLSADGGWKLKYIENAIKQPPGHAYKYRFDQVFNKLAIFAQTDYDTVVYLDADTLVMENIDELCTNMNTEMGAVMRGPSFNSGVLVIRPNMDMFKRLVTEINLVNPRYLNNDQGYLNTVFWDFSTCDYVDPMLESIEEEARPLTCARLPARYNGDVLIYAVNNNHWPYNPVSETYESPKIIHYTFGDIKPWHWYSYLLTPNVWYWWYTYRSSFVSSNVIIYRSLVGTALSILINIVFFLVSDVASNALMKYLYEQFKTSLAGLCCIFFVLQLLGMWLAYGISTLYFFSPEINAFLCMIVLWHIMKIILFNFLPQQQKYVAFAYGIVPTLFFMILLFGSGEEITFFARVFVVSGLIVVFHWLIFWTMFVRYVVGPLYEEPSAAVPKEIKDF